MLLAHKIALDPNAAQSLHFARAADYRLGLRDRLDVVGLHHDRGEPPVAPTAGDRHALQRPGEPHGRQIAYKARLSGALVVVPEF